MPCFFAASQRAKALGPKFSYSNIFLISLILDCKSIYFFDIKEFIKSMASLAIANAVFL